MALPGHSWLRVEKGGGEEEGAKKEEGKKKESHKRDIVMSV